MDEILADGEWHDGRDMLREAGKLIPPGIALRNAEKVRDNARRRRGQEESERNDTLTTASLITMGRNRITQRVVHTRIDGDSWEARPGFPLPRGEWLRGGWEVRDVRVGRHPLTVLADRYHMASGAMRQLILADPPIPHITSGRILRVHERDLEDLEQRVAEHRANARVRRANAARRYRANLRANPPEVTRLSLTALHSRYKLRVETVRSLLDEHPDIPREIVGKTTYVPLDSLPAFEEAAEKRRQERPPRGRNHIRHTLEREG